jgi:hypothetical protein
MLEKVEWDATGLPQDSASRLMHSYNNVARLRQFLGARRQASPKTAQYTA